MKNQYVGDIGDYGKYGLLRFLADKGIEIGVNWYMTENDKTNDGKFIKYLEAEDERFRDEQLFDFLKGIAKDPNKQVGMIEDGEVIPGAVYFSEAVSKVDREGWHARAMEALAGVELVFCDPDNGPIGAKDLKAKDADKFVTPGEIEDYYKAGKNVVYYCQRARRSVDAWAKTKNEMLEWLPDAKLITLTFHKGTQRSYIFVVKPEEYKRYVNLLYEFVRGKWGRGRWFEIEEQGVEQNKRADDAGNYLKMELRNGKFVELRMRDDGWVDIRKSWDPNTTSTMEAEMIVRLLGV